MHIYVEKYYRITLDIYLSSRDNTVLCYIKTFMSE